MIRNVFLGAIALLVLMVSGVSLAQSGSGTPYRPGEKVFMASCNGCHPHGGNSIQHNRPILNSAQLSDFGTFNQYIRTPKEPDGARGLMPPFPKSRISDQQSKELYDYIVHVLENRGGGGKNG
ncbi:MAG: c-type cytochrome [Syntrophobacteraceae bacterium]